MEKRKFRFPESSDDINLYGISEKLNKTIGKKFPQPKIRTKENDWLEIDAINITKQLVTKSTISILIKIDWQKNSLIHTNKNKTIVLKSPESIWT